MTASTFDSREWTETIGPDGGPVTARMVLFGDDPRAVVPRGGWNALRERVAHVRSDLRPLVERELAVAVVGLLDVDLGETLLAGWRAHAKLLGAAQATVDSPGTTEVVNLVTHRITSNHQPHVDLVVDGVKIATVEVTVEIVIDVDGLLASVHAGRLVALHGGRCEVRVTFLYAGSELASGVATLEAPATVSLGAGVDLLRREVQSGGAAHGHAHVPPALRST